jgi:hypothetical protein
LSTSDPTITNDYNQLITFSGYNPGQNYGVQFWQATHDPSNALYQDLASTLPDFQANSVPEPSSAVMGAAGLLFIVAMISRRRSQRRPACRP